MEAALNRATQRTFGRPAEYLAAGAAEDDPRTAIRGIFDGKHMLVDMMDPTDGTLFSATHPVFRVRDADMATAGIEPGQMDNLWVDGVKYRVTDTRPDGSGQTLLVLQEQRGAEIN